jgi:NADPH:quinone reductase-like Zn-dependent oxidoreductase
MSVTQHTAENLFVDGANGVRYAYRRFGADSGRQSGLVSIPEQLSSVEASPLLCAGFTTYNALRKAQPKPGGLMAVQGIGGLGHLGVQYARKMGATVVAIARGTAKADLAHGLGAHHYIDSSATDVGAELTKLAQIGLPSGRLVVGRRTWPHWPHGSRTSGSVW